MAGIKRMETARMQLVSALLKSATGETLREYLARAVTGEVELSDGTKVQATWDDLAFDIRTATGERVVRETVSNWATRYGIEMPKRESGAEATDEQESAAV